MDNLLGNLSSILEECESLGSQIRYESSVLSRELTHRLSLDLSPDEEIAHFNEWMKRYGLFHLVVE